MNILLPYCENQFEITCLSIWKNSVILHYIVFGGDLVLNQVSIHYVKHVKLIIHKITVTGEDKNKFPQVRLTRNHQSHLHPSRLTYLTT